MEDKEIQIKEKNDKQLFINEIQRRAISKLVHFTSCINLYNIVNYGAIIPRNKLQNSNNSNLRNADFTDSLRLDGDDHINCSIERINTSMFNSKNCRYDGQTDFLCILAIDPKYIYRESTQFSVTNAANKFNRDVIGINGTFVKFLSMFDSQISYYTSYSNKTIIRSSSLSENYTTDIQAEVLIYDDILITDIIAIYVQNESHLCAVKSLITLSNPFFNNTIISIEPEMFI